MRQLRRPIAAEAAAHAGDPFAVDVIAGFQIIHRRGKSSLRAEITAEAWIFAGTWHVDGKTGKTIFEQDVVVGAPIFFPAVDAAPVHHHRGSIYTVRHLQITDNLLALERDFDPLQGWVHRRRRL